MSVDTADTFPRSVFHRCGKVLWIRMALAFSEHGAREAWSRVLERARAQLPQTTIAMWFADVHPAALDSGVLTLGVPSDLVRERLQRNHLDLIRAAAAEAA